MSKLIQGEESIYFLRATFKPYFWKLFESIGKQIKQTKETAAKNYAGLKKGDILMNQRMFTGRLLEVTRESAKLLREDSRHSWILRSDVKINAEPLLDAIKDWRP